MTTTVISDKYNVVPATNEIAMNTEAASCLNFVRVREDISLVRDLSCEELVAYPGNEVDYCSGLISELKGANQDAVVVVETEQLVSYCAPEEVKDRGQRGQRGQR